MKQIYRVCLVLSIAFSSFIVINAQEESTTIIALDCAIGEGCTRIESSITQVEAEILLNEPAPEGDTTPYVVCASGLGCKWTQQPPEEIDLLFDGDGIDDIVFTEEEGLIIVEEDNLEFEEDEGLVVEDDIEFTEEDILEIEEALCDDADDCTWTDLSPEEIYTMFPEFVGVAYLITPREGPWQGMSFPPVLDGCPATTTDALAGYTVSQSGTFDVGENFEISDLLVIPGATTSNPVPNIYSIIYAPDPSTSVGFVYRVVSNEYIQANMRFVINVPGVLTCTASVDFEFEYLG